MKPVIEITSTDIEEFKGVSKKTGNDYHIRNQTAYFFSGGAKYPTPMKLTLNDGQSAYAPGKYHLADNSISVDRNGRLSLYNLALVPVPAAAAASPAKSA